MSQHSCVHHAINYIEIPARDLEITKAFYNRAFAWEFNEYGPDYLGICKPGDSGEMGGICRSENITTGGLLVILYSANLEESLSAVKEAGAEIAVEIFSFPGGRRFEFRDPNGHQLAVWSDVDSHPEAGSDKS